MKVPNRLNLSVAMFKDIFISVIVISVVVSVAATAMSGVDITSPVQGQILKGSVDVKGTISADDFISANLSYAYADTQIETWFIIQSFNKPASNAVLCVWDTSTISDGTYKLKLSVLRKNGEIQDIIIDNIQVRNYSQAEHVVTQTVINPSFVSETVKPEDKVVMEATPYPINKASASMGDVGSEIKNGIIIGVASLLAFGVYSSIRGFIYRR